VTGLLLSALLTDAALPDADDADAVFELSPQPAKTDVDNIRLKITNATLVNFLFAITVLSFSI
jgi:hypothetical protein